MKHLVRVSCICAVMAGGAFGQGNRGTIAWTVTDPSAAVIAGLRVIAENAATPNPNGQLTGGFGFMNVNDIAAGTARNMRVVARLAF